MCNRCQFVCVEFSACRTLLLIASLKELYLALPVFIIYTFQAFFGLCISTVMHVVHSPKRGIRACSPGKIQIFWEFEMHWHSGRMFHVQCRMYNVQCSMFLGHPSLFTQHLFWLHSFLHTILLIFYKVFSLLCNEKIGLTPLNGSFCINTVNPPPPPTNQCC